LIFIETETIIICYDYCRGIIWCKRESCGIFFLSLQSEKYANINCTTTIKYLQQYFNKLTKYFYLRYGYTPLPKYLDKEITDSFRTSWNVNKNQVASDTFDEWYENLLSLLLCHDIMARISIINADTGK
jgi:hypothetical protein